MTSPQRQPASRLEELLRAGRFVITAEITPPVSCNADDLLRKALPLAGLADAVNVTDGASARAHLSAPIAAALLAVYIVLGVLYESYIHPITILSTLPSAGVGA